MDLFLNNPSSVDLQQPLKRVTEIGSEGFWMVAGIVTVYSSWMVVSSHSLVVKAVMAISYMVASQILERARLADVESWWLKRHPVCCAA